MAKLLADVNPPIMIAAGRRQELIALKAMIHTMHPETVPVVVDLIFSPNSAIMIKLQYSETRGIKIGCFSCNWRQNEVDSLFRFARDGQKHFSRSNWQILFHPRLRTGLVGSDLIAL